MMYYVRRFFDALLYPMRALLASPGKVFSTGQRLFGLSLPARVAILVGFFLIILVVVSYVAFYLLPERAFWATMTRPSRLLVIAVLVVVIPIVVYHLLRLWLEGGVSPFDDIDLAWNAGLAELQRNGLDLSQIPIFLVLGSAGERQEKALFDASGLSLNLREVPQGPAALHWYANPDGIYIVSTNTGCLSRLATAAKDVFDEEQSRPGPLGPRPAGDAIRGTIVAGGEKIAADSVTSSGPAPGAPSAGHRDLPSNGRRAQNAGKGYDIRGTMMVSSDTMSAAGGMDSDYAGPSSQKRPITLSPDEASEQDRRLEYLCQLIRRTRRPVCPINGILTLLPFGLIQRGPREGVELQRTLRRDLATAQRVFKLRCPVTAMVVGMEEDSGFRELVRRVGRDRTARQRFGKGFALSNPPLPERLEALCAHACGSFEDWVYALFREKGSLSKPGNTRLYALLCKIRRNVQTRLGNILVAGYGSDPDQDPAAEPLLFGGCYFAAIGETEDRQAFTKGVLDKLPEEQGELQWGREALAEDQKYQHFAQIVLGFDFLLFVALVGMIVYSVFWK